ncbi:hypothetical protein CAAN1_11S02278 [[Candida] anglica]|uniref:Phosphatidylethanolamine-binding protein n=1 Tax=[Candida] anglica TaxID=148631 RepID=A0ABP0EI27_9ASCO
MGFIERTLGKLFYNYKLTEDALMINQEGFKDAPRSLTLTSEDFKDGEHMPVATAGVGVGDNKCPSLKITGLEPNAKSYVLLCQDIDVPILIPVTHMVIYNISPSKTTFALDELSESTSDLYKRGKNLYRNTKYLGPRPLEAHGPHRYCFQAFGINEIATTALSKLSEPPRAIHVQEIIKGNVVSTGLLTGIYNRE